MEDYHDRLIHKTASMLARWRGAPASLWAIRLSHRSARVLVGRRESSQNLLISCLDPSHFSGPVAWQANDLTLQKWVSGTRTLGFQLVDESVGFRMRMGDVELAENVKRNG